MYNIVGDIMSIKVYYSNQLNEKFASYKKTFTKIAQFIYNDLALKGKYEMSVTFVDDETIQTYNADYRGIDRPTDVLSFALNETTEKEQSVQFNEDVLILLGDIFISYPTALRQAEEYGHSKDREICFLFTHGVLHLLGYDHMEKEEEKEMFGLQDRILDTLGIYR